MDVAIALSDNDLTASAIVRCHWPYSVSFAGTCGKYTVCAGTVASDVSRTSPTTPTIVNQGPFGRLRNRFPSAVRPVASFQNCRAVLWLMSLASVLSFNHWAEYQLFGHTFFDSMDYLTANWLMPLGGLGTVLFTGWVLQKEAVREAIGIAQPGWFNAWWNLLRYGTPVAITLVFLNLIGVI